MRFISATIVSILVIGLSIEGFPEEGHNHKGHDKPSGSEKPRASGEVEHKEERSDSHAEKGEEGHEHAEEGGAGHKDEDEHGHDEEGSASVGEGKAVTAIANEGTRFRLAPEAQATIGLKLGPIQSLQGVFRIPKAALLEYQANTAVFVGSSDGWLELTTVTVVSRSPEGILVKSSKLKSSDQVAIQGVALLRAAQLQASGQGGEGHGH